MSSDYRTPFPMPVGLEKHDIYLIEGEAPVYQTEEE